MMRRAGIVVNGEFTNLMKLQFILNGDAFGSKLLLKTRASSKVA